ncbi:hypothetical protein LEP1GSC188_1465 [Leptospira weilii serovar Topaz str. LT2116]|uniref:Uncharacterized protein n=1 Tax=Leptospira weilii serovar Topaz str. LT2116 TaxID=1088540 RepID=M3GT35_9LEPT|nr:hypothetical protein LEP1GSC188_1465 [Leptospira weilii serovar Topaz str. LT2116]
MSNFEIFELVMMYTIAGTLVVWSTLAILALFLATIIWREEIFSFFKTRKEKS